MPHTASKSKGNRLQSSAAIDAPQQVDVVKLSAALTAALKILRPGTTAQAKVSKRGAAK